MMASPTSRSAFLRTALILALVAGGVPAVAQEQANQSANQIASNQTVSEVVLIPNRVIYPGETVELGVLKQVTLLPGKHKPDAVATRDAWLVEQGAAVQIYFTAGGLTISASGVTLQPGAAGDLVKVRNVDSGKIISGTVMADGTIRVSAT
jgi:flagellar basal body P-ring formation protein FlgA